MTITDEEHCKQMRRLKAEHERDDAVATLRATKRKLREFRKAVRLAMTCGLAAGLIQQDAAAPGTAWAEVATLANYKGR